MEVSSTFSLNTLIYSMYIMFQWIIKKIKRVPSNEIVYLIASVDYCIKYYASFQIYLNYQSFTYCSCCLHIGYLYNTTSKSELNELFSKYAIVRNIRIRRQGSIFCLVYCKLDRRFAFIDFFSIEDACRVKTILNRSNLWKGCIQFARNDSM